jgi:hypothetical protein
MGPSPTDHARVKTRPAFRTAAVRAPSGEVNPTWRGGADIPWRPCAALGGNRRLTLAD